MNIAQITSIYIPVPPPTHGGTEIIVSLITEELHKRRHNVHLYASGDSVTKGTLHAITDQATLDQVTLTRYLEKELETRNSFELYKDADQYDVIHAHWPVLAPYFSKFTPTPTVLTYHYIEPELHQYYKQNFPSIYPVCVSQRQADLIGDPELPVIHNGLNFENMTFNNDPEDYLVLVARMVPSKGIVEAIQIAKKAKTKLILIGAVSSYIPWSKSFYEQEVLPHIDGSQIIHFSELANTKVIELISKAKAFLFPLQWDEPFGLVLTEAMGCGTPVIAFPRGSVPELVEDNLTGFIVQSPEEAVDAIAKVHQLDRKAVSNHAKKKFSHEQMVDHYESFYKSLI